MLHAVQAVSILSLAMGVAVIVLGLLAYARYSSVSFRDLTVTMGAALVVLVVDMLKEHDLGVPAELAAGPGWLYAALAGAGHGLFAYAVIGLAFRVAGRAFSGAHLPLRLLLTGVLLLAGVWRELVPGAVSAAVAAVLMVGVQAYGLAVMGAGLSRLDSDRVRRLIHLVLQIAPPLLLLVIAQSIAAVFVSGQTVFRDLPFSQVLYLLGLESLLLIFGLRYLFRAEPQAANPLPNQFVVKFSISPREREIISMIVQGYSNRMIGEKLFISAMTVKNHIYHIYQKTSAGNKVQLINLINSLK